VLGSVAAKSESQTPQHDMIQHGSTWQVRHGLANWRYLTSHREFFGSLAGFAHGKEQQSAEASAAPQPVDAPKGRRRRAGRLM